jgi:hypothetical protein
LPPSWTSGDVELALEGVDYSLSCCDNAKPVPNDCRVSVSFVDTPEIKLRLIPCTWYGIDHTPHEPEYEDLEWVARAVETMYPVSRVDWDSTHDIVREWPGRYSLPGLNVRIAMLRAMDSITRQDQDRIYVGVLVDPPGRWAILGYGGSGVASGYWTHGYAGVLPHEIGHILGRDHTLCAGKELGPDPDYPYADGHISTEDEGDTAFYGFSANSLQIYPPSTGDLMSYCRPNWPSKYTYEHLHDQIGKRFGPSGQPVTALADPGPVVAIAGIITPTDNLGTIHALYLTNSDMPPALPEPGTYEIRLRDPSGQVLTSYPFEPSVEFPDPFLDCEPSEQEPVGGFALVLPWNPAAARIELAHHGVPLDAAVASAHAPAVTLLSPNGGEHLDGPSTAITWSVSDSDGNALHYAIQYSADSGASWTTLATSWTLTEYELDLDSVSGTDQGLVRVFASDGFHTSQDGSDGTFAVSRHHPRASIRSPKNDSLYVADQLIILEGSAYDNEDGQLADAALSWSSDLDGPLGAGESLAIVASSLSEGSHTITLSAQDSEAQTETASITVRIYRDRPTLPATLAVAPDVMTFVAAEGSGQTASGSISIRNDGDSTMTWSAAADRDWILTSWLEGTAPSDVSVAADATGLPIGEYTGSITVTAAAAAGSPQTVHVTLHVRPMSYKAYLPLVLRH